MTSRDLVEHITNSISLYRINTAYSPLVTIMSPGVVVIVVVAVLVVVVVVEGVV